MWNQQRPKEGDRTVLMMITELPKEGSAKECSSYCTTALISHASEVMLKTLQARLQKHMNHELPDVQNGFRKSRVTRGQIANIRWIMEKGREFQITIYFCFINYAEAFDCAFTTNCGKLFKRWEYQTTLPVSCET